MLGVLTACFALSTASAAPATYEYDNLGRLTRVSHGDGSFTRFEYDADGNRTRRVTVAKPTLLIDRRPNPMIANEFFEVKWRTTGATSLSYACTAAGTGFNESSALPPHLLPDGSASMPSAPPGWVGFDSNCVWNANGPGGSLQISEVLRTVPAVPGRPTLAITRIPNPMIAGRPFKVTTRTTGAVSLTYLCTAPGTGYNGNGPMPVPDGIASSNAADFGWVGHPSACRWTATAANGATLIHDESLVTVPDADAQAGAGTY